MGYSNISLRPFIFHLSSIVDCSVVASSVLQMNSTWRTVFIVSAMSSVLLHMNGIKKEVRWAFSLLLYKDLHHMEPLRWHGKKKYIFNLFEQNNIFFFHVTLGAPDHHLFFTIYYFLFTVQFLFIDELSFIYCFISSTIQRILRAILLALASAWRRRRRRRRRRRQRRPLLLVKKIFKFAG